jgi:DNA repair exonuclease SbcCD nuclease subunit
LDLAVTKPREFARPLVFSDIHLGLKGDSDRHNQDCIEFVDWLIEQFHEHRCDAFVFLGDWFHNETRVQWNTLWATNQILAKLSQIGVPIYVCVGNHDMWFKHTREIHALGHFQWVPNVYVVNDLLQFDDLLLCPYLLGSEFNAVANIQVDYIFGHFALPGFLTNETYVYETRDGMQTDFFEGPKAVYSGHFHKRQTRVNTNGTEIVYIGNCFPHNWNDLGDRDRGCMIFERDKDPIFLNWDKAPTYDRLDLSKLLVLIDDQTLHQKFSPKATIHLSDDIGLSDVDLFEMRTLLGTQGFREIKIETAPDPEQQEQILVVPPPNENIHDYFKKSLNQVDTKGSKYQINLLQDLFSGAVEKTDNG